jgi:hypothetical protein
MRAPCDERRIDLADGAGTTVHVAAFGFDVFRPRIVCFRDEEPLERWAAREGVTDAVSGGFSTKPAYEPLGELWIGGRAISHCPFANGWHRRRAALLIEPDRIAIDSRDRLPKQPRGDLLQAGPLLVRDAVSAIAGVDDPEGFSETCEEFDQDLTASREPRLALALAGDGLLAVAADGRAPHDSGLTLWELADVLVELGATSAINLDGGSASAIVAGGRRLNTPRDDEGEEMEESSESVTAIRMCE